jgi:hypothetical protein
MRAGHLAIHSGEVDMRKSLLACALALFVATPAVASDETDVMQPIHQFVDGFNKGDVKSALAACAEETSIIDEFPRTNGTAPARARSGPTITSRTRRKTPSATASSRCTRHRT